MTNILGGTIICADQGKDAWSGQLNKEVSVWNLCALSSSTSESTGFTSSSGKGTTYESCEAMLNKHCIFFVFFIFAVMASMGCLKTSRGRGAIGERTRGKSYLGKVFRSEIFYAAKIFFVWKRLIFSCFYAAMPCGSSTYYQCISIYFEYNMISLHAETTKSLSKKSINIFAEGIEKRFTL